jgi:hypothetical protein
MKIHSFSAKSILVAVVLTSAAIFITKPSISQEAVKKDSGKKVTLKIYTNENGKKTVIDTTMEMPATGMNDTITEEFDKIIEMDKDGKHACVKIRKMPEGFNYKFDMPCQPECNMAFDELENLDWERMAPGQQLDELTWDEMVPGQERRIMRREGHGQWLNDILGEIPMDRVVSYSIKDRKNGKRIIIDLNDAPMFERQDKVIIIREPGGTPRNYKTPHRKMRVYVTPDSDNQMEQTPALPEAPDTPPPPPPVPDKSAPKKPKI